MIYDFRSLDSISNLGEINKLLLIIGNLCSENTYETSLERVRRIHKEKCIKGYITPFHDLIETTLLLGLTKINEDKIKLTSLGIKLLKINKGRNYEFTPEQNMILITSLLFSRCPLETQVNGLIKGFSLNASKGRYEHSGDGLTDVRCDRRFQLFASTISLLEADKDGTLYLNPNYTYLIRRKIRIMRGGQWWDREPTKREIEASKDAELLVEKSEVERLKKMGRSDLAGNVELISDYNPIVGYDIKSYEGVTSRVEDPDRLLEVKESVKPEVRFYLSHNELKIAREYRGKYHIVFVGNHVIGKKLNECDITIIDDPAITLFDIGQFEINARRYIVKKI